MHPYEDWAETWVNYMHIIDTLETAQNFSITCLTAANVSGTEGAGELNLPEDTYFFLSQTSIISILDTWMDFSVILKSLNRSMGMSGAYPFVLSHLVCTKLSFIHHAIHDSLDHMPEMIEEADNA
jgi:hypothetical protein